MKSRRQAFVFSAITAATMMSAAFLTRTAAASDDARAAAVKAVEIARFSATVAGDTKAVEKVLADDLEYCHSNGECETKAEYMQMMTSGKRKYVAFTPTVKSVRLFTDVALVSGIATVTVITDGKSQDIHIGYSDVYVWRSHRWQMTSWRSTHLDSPK
jgi:hypothetical protein